MIMKILNLFGIYFFALICFFSIGCANIIPPSGGPRDSIPPILIHSLPKDSSINFSSKKITLTFNEFVEVKEIQQNLIVNPIPINQPLVDYKLKNVFITLKDSLEPNTTYSLDFGNAIKDVNEGNIAINQKFIFSTSNKIDINNIKGKVIVAHDGSIDSTLIAVLHSNLNDTAIYKTKPIYICKLNGKGEFAFYHLPSKEYNVFIIPNSFNKRFDDSTKLFGFLNSPISSKEKADENIIYVFKEAEPQINNIPQRPTDTKGNKKITYSTNIQNGRLDILDSLLTIKTNKKITAFNKVGISLVDTNYKKIENLIINLDTSLTYISLDFKEEFDTKYYLLIDKESLMDSAENSLIKNDTIPFTTFKELDYGKTKLRCNQIITNEVIQIYKDDKLLNSYKAAKEIVINLYKPGEYDIRILKDENNNKIWDTGNYKLKKQPETATTLKTKLIVKANWDNEIEINW